MDRNYGKLTVYFENPFWVGVLEQNLNRLYRCKGKKTNWSENLSAVNSGKQRSNVNLN